MTLSLPPAATAAVVATAPSSNSHGSAAASGGSLIYRWLSLFLFAFFTISRSGWRRRFVHNSEMLLPSSCVENIRLQEYRIPVRFCRGRLTHSRTATQSNCAARWQLIPRKERREGEERRTSEDGWQDDLTKCPSAFVFRWPVEGVGTGCRICCCLADDAATHSHFLFNALRNTEGHNTDALRSRSWTTLLYTLTRTLMFWTRPQLAKRLWKVNSHWLHTRACNWDMYLRGTELQTPANCNAVRKHRQHGPNVHVTAD